VFSLPLDGPQAHDRSPEKIRAGQKPDCRLKQGAEKVVSGLFQHPVKAWPHKSADPQPKKISVSSTLL
jgi:hypothetical protein